MSCDPEKDPRYDVVLRDHLCSGTGASLPLLLVEQGSLGQTTGMIAAFGGQLSAGDRETLTLEQFTTRTQSDFSGGMGQYEAKGATNRYHQGVCDSRFAGHLISPPKRNAVTRAGAQGFFTIYGSDLICAGYSTLYKWNGTGWDLLAVLGGEITGVQVFNKRLWVAVGGAVKRATSDWGDVFEDVINVAATHLLVYNGYLYLLGSAGQLVYTNGTDWSDILKVGDGSTPLNALVGFRNEIIVIGARGMWSMNADIVYQIHDWRDMEYANAGKGARVWAGDACLYVPLRSGLWRWDGSVLRHVSADLEQELPAAQRGVISAIIGTHEHLYVAVNAGDSGISGVYGMDAQGEWHCVQLATVSGQGITALGIDMLTSTGLRLWWVQSYWIVHVYLPERWTDIGAGFGYDWESDGYVITSTIGSDARWIDKDIDGVWLHVDNLENGKRWVEVWAEYDKSGIWVNLGVMDESPYGYIRLCQPYFAPKTVRSFDAGTGEVMLYQNTAYDLTPGAFVLIGNEHAQVKQVTLENRFTLARFMNCPPTDGMAVTGSRPVAREVRLKLVLKLANSTGSCPIVRSVALKFQDRLIEYRRFTLNVKIQNGMEDRQGGRYPFDAATLRGMLNVWVARATPFELLDVTGKAYVVKVTSVNESQYSNGNSVMTIGLTQVQPSCA